MGIAADEEKCDRDSLEYRDIVPDLEKGCFRFHPVLFEHQRIAYLTTEYFILDLCLCQCLSNGIGSLVKRMVQKGDER